MFGVTGVTKFGVTVFGVTGVTKFSVTMWRNRRQPLVQPTNPSLPPNPNRVLSSKP